MSSPRLSARALVTLVLFWCFVTLLISGVVLYVSPQGRIANWNDWRLLALAKDDWARVHTVTSLLFIIGGLFHLLAFNRGPILAYLRRGRRGERSFAAGVLAGTGVFALVLVGAVAALPPFSSLMDLGARAKAAWAGPAGAPPAPHLEDERLSKLALRLGAGPAEVRGRLVAAGLVVPDGDVRLREVGEINRLSPRQVWDHLTPLEKPDAAAPPAALGAGLGRKTLGQVAEELGVPWEDAVERLQARGVKPKRGATMRELADAAGVSPHELGEWLLPVS